MARIVAGVGCSHVHAIGEAIDLGKTEDEYWRRLFAGFTRAKELMSEIKPDLIIGVFNDHGSALSLQYIPTFSIGVAAEFKPADEGWGARQVPIVKGDREFAGYLAESLILDEFDMTVINEMDLDHGLTVPLSLLLDMSGANASPTGRSHQGTPNQWPCPVIPVCVNALSYPTPSGKRCFSLGRAIRKAVAGYEKDLRIVVLGTGGMSHQIHGERSGLINSPWDRRFLDRLSSDPLELTRMPLVEYVREAGAESVEMVMWLVMRGALDDDVEEAYRFYHVPASNTAVGNIILMNGSSVVRTTTPPVSPFGLSKQQA
jgi:protocatechuate 4,5-dioxygenase, beta chain